MRKMAGSRNSMERKRQLVCLESKYVLMVNQGSVKRCWVLVPGSRQVPRLEHLEQSRNRWFIIVLWTPVGGYTATYIFSLVQIPSHQIRHRLLSHFPFVLLPTVLKHSRLCGRPTDQVYQQTRALKSSLWNKKTLRCGSFGFRNIHQTSYTLSVFFHTRPGGIFMRPDKVADRAGRKAGCWTH